VPDDGSDFRGSIPLGLVPTLRTDGRREFSPRTAADPARYRRNGLTDSRYRALAARMDAQKLQAVACASSARRNKGACLCAAVSKGPAPARAQGLYAGGKGPLCFLFRGGLSQYRILSVNEISLLDHFKASGGRLPWTRESNWTMARRRSIFRKVGPSQGVITSAHAAAPSIAKAWLRRFRVVVPRRNWRGTGGRE